MIMGFTGTRHGMTEAQMATFEKLVQGGLHTFRHGGCEGADVEAARIVRKVLGEVVRIVCHPGPPGDTHQKDSGVDDKKLEGRNHFGRNREIVRESDRLVACPYQMFEERKGGTWYTVQYARKWSKPVVIIWPDGSIGS